MTDTRPHPAHAPGVHAPHAYAPVRVLWWIYLALMGLNWVLSWFDARTLVDMLGIAFWGMALAGLAGYLLRRALGPRLLWMAYLALFVLWLLVQAGMMIARNPGAGVLASVAAAGATALVFGPTAWALWRYAWRCPDLWLAAR